MSWDIYLEGENGPVDVPRHVEGGTYAIGGTEAAELNVTYNYNAHFPFRELDGLTALETIPRLEDMVKHLGTIQDSDYWKATPGNAGHALNVLLSWARLHPTAKWRVS